MTAGPKGESRLESEAAAPDGATRAAQDRISFDLLPIAAFEIAATGAVCCRNAMARALLERREFICVDQDMLVATRPAESRRLRDAIERVRLGRQPMEALSLSATASERRLHLLLSARPDGPPPRALVVLADSADIAPVLSEQHVRTWFDLTPREATLAVRLASGLSLEAASRQIGIAAGTSRSHLKQIFRKMKVRTRSELVVRLLRTPSAGGPV